MKWKAYSGNKYGSTIIGLSSSYMLSSGSSEETHYSTEERHIFERHGKDSSDRQRAEDQKAQMDAKNDAMYELTDLGNGTYAISYQDNTVPAKAAGILGGNSNETTLYKKLVSFVFWLKE